MTQAWKRKILAAALAGFAAYCYLSHLAGALGANSDENRAYHFQLLTPFLYFLSKPLIQWFRSFDPPYYIQGVTGLAGILLTVLIVRRVVSPAAGWIAAVFLVLYDYPLAYAKLLYYSTPQYFFLALATVLFLRANRLGSRWLYGLAGVSIGMMILVNASGIIPAALLTVFFLVCHHFQIFHPSKISFIQALALLTAGSLLAFGAFEACLTIWYGLHPSLERMSFFKSAVGYAAVTPDFYTLGFSYVRNQITDIASRAFSRAEGGWFRSSFVLLAVVAGGVLALIRREKRAALFAGLLTCGIAGVLLLTLLNVQPFFERTLMWTVLPITVLAAYAVETVWRRTAGFKRGLFAVALAVYGFFGVQKCLAVTHATFSVNPILRTLEERGIPKHRVVTTFPISGYDLYRPGQRTKDTPLLVSRDPVLIAQGKSHMIYWPPVYAEFRKGTVGYYLSSGIGGLLSEVGETDSLLKSVRPLAEWDHPSSNRHLYAGQRPATIRLYDLGDVLNRPEAAAYVEEMEKKFKTR